jgi:hypothetical protein
MIYVRDVGGENKAAFKLFLNRKLINQDLDTDCVTFVPSAIQGRNHTLKVSNLALRVMGLIGVITYSYWCRR